MRIGIEEKFRPFSHRSGIDILLPSTDVEMKIFVTKFLISTHEISFDIQGPVKGFTVIQDIERKCVFVFGTSLQGFYQIKIYPQKNQVVIKLERGPESGFQYELLGKKHVLGKKQQLQLSTTFQTFETQNERLSFGSHKSQNWEKMQEKLDLKQILPIWYFLAQMSPSKKPSNAELSVLKEKKSFEEKFQSFFQVNNRGMFIPTMNDDEHQGIELADKNENSLAFLRRHYEQVRMLFFQQEKNTLTLLPHLPSLFICGRMTNVQCASLGELDFEWSKKRIRRLVFRASEDAAIHWKFSQIKQYRMQTQGLAKKTKIAKGWPMEVVAGQTYYLDHFEK